MTRPTKALKKTQWIQFSRSEARLRAKRGRTWVCWPLKFRSTETQYLFLASSILALILLLILTGFPADTQATPLSAVNAPTLKWSYLGCFSSWCETGWYASPAVANLDNDPQAEIIWGAYDLSVFDGLTGSEQWRADNGSRIWPGIAVADLTGDGDLEIIVGRGSDQVTVYNHTGGVEWTRNPFGGGEVRTLAVENLESTGTMEVIVGRASGGSYQQLNVFEANGSQRAG